jgi:hypothetical protein
VIVARTEAEFDQSARVGNFFRLPAVVALISAHGFFAIGVPRSRWLAGQIVFTNQSCLNFLCSPGIDLLLSARAYGFLAGRTFRRRAFGSGSRAGMRRCFMRCGRTLCCWRSWLLGCSRSRSRIATRTLLARKRGRNQGARQNQRARGAMPCEPYSRPSSRQRKNLYLQKKKPNRSGAVIILD